MFYSFVTKLASPCLVVAALLTAPMVSAQNLDQNLPLDPKVTIGKLENGLTYYIRPNNKPEKKVELRLIVNAGSILEDDDQQGLAHFMEHMNFNGTKNFPKNELVGFLQSIGVEFGADLNAYTSFDETVYILPIPTDKPGNLEKGFQILEDWAHNALMTDADIDNERGVVLEESRSGKGADDRMMQQYLPRLFAGSQYAHRLPIGKDDILKNFKYDAVRRFYKEWYRPDLMAVAVVGDITVAQAEKLVKTYFSRLKNPENAPARKVFEVLPYTEPGAMVVTDKEATNYMFQLVFSARKEKADVTLRDYRASMVRDLFIAVLNRRLQALTQSGNPPYLYAAGYIGGWARDYENFTLMAAPSTDIAFTVNTAIAELVKAQQYGFNPSELDIARKQVLSRMEKAYNERNTTESGRIVSEYVRSFLNAEAIPGIENEYAYYQEMLPAIQVEDLNAVAKEWLSIDQNKEYFALITGPDSRQMKVPTDLELAQMVESAFAQQVVADDEKEIASSLLDKMPVPGKVVAAAKNKELGTTTYTLSNGVKVTLKPTEFKSDEILLNGVKKGGSSNYGPEDKANVTFVSRIISAMGTGNFTPTDLRNFIAGKTVSLNQSIGSLSSNVRGNAAVKDLETLLQLNYLTLTAPRKDIELYNGFVANQKAQLQFLTSNPQYAFFDTLSKSMFNNDPRAPITIPTAADFDRINLDRILEIYQNELGYADDFHFFLVGNVDTATIVPLLEQYIGSLPVKGTKAAFKDNGLRPVTGRHLLDFQKGSEQQSLIFAQYFGDIDYSEDLALKANMVAEILNIKVIEEMREKMAAIYSGGFSAEVEKEPYPNYSIRLFLPCGPENVPLLLKETEKEIAHLKQNGVDKKDLDKVKLALLEKRKESIKTNGYWLGKLEQLQFWNYDQDRFLKMESIVNKISSADIKAAANRLFEGKNSFVAVLYPEVAQAQNEETSQGVNK